MPIYPTGKKKDGKQQYRVRINYTEAGEYRQKEQLCWGYKESLDLEQRLKAMYINDGGHGTMLLRDFYGEYMAYKRGDVRETTLDRMRSNVENHILPFLGDYALADIDARVVAKWKSDMNQKGLSVTYCRRIFGSLNALLNYAVKLKYIPENPTKSIENFRDSNFTAPDEKLHYYTAEQFQQFIDAADRSVEDYFDRSVYVFFVIAYFTGLRKGEIHALRWNDISENCIHVRRSITQKIKGKKTLETAPKNKASVRVLQIPQPLQNVLNQYLVLQKLHFGKKWKSDFRVILGDRCVSDSSLSNYNIKWAKQANLPAIRIHDYRHSHASLLANEGINIQEIARRLGHSNVQITWRTYSHLYPREEERAVGVLNKVEICFSHKKSTKK